MDRLLSDQHPIPGPAARPITARLADEPLLALMRRMYPRHTDSWLENTEPYFKLRVASALSAAEQLEHADVLQWIMIMPGNVSLEVVRRSGAYYARPVTPFWEGFVMILPRSNVR